MLVEVHDVHQLLELFEDNLPVVVLVSSGHQVYPHLVLYVVLPAQQVLYLIESDAAVAVQVEEVEGGSQLLVCDFVLLLQVCLQEIVVVYLLHRFLGKLLENDLDLDPSLDFTAQDLGVAS